jgi:HD-GYP domain-containing protein (c-di-GMP phosphodiesterase class II)
MLTISDIFDALTASDRPYRKAATPDRAVSILREEAAANKLDSDLVEVFADRVVPSILSVIPGRTL